MERTQSHEVATEKNDVLQREYADPSDSDGFSINEAARGDDLPDNYYMSWTFIGTLAVRK